ncbi:MAG: hypothetical protein PHQ35_09715 [Phycisphaerae bacterium]|nr:hypothetical protein [Phycisphaerae bacterium]MDD5239995.1 hypothetical protein [Candidatus Nanoarchaeia archaeon]
MAQFTVEIKSISAINKLKSLGRHKGEYIAKLIEGDIRFEQLERRVKELEVKQNG